MWQYAVYALLLSLSVWLMRWKRAYLGGADAVFVSGDPYNVIVVHAVLTTKTPIAFATFQQVVNEKIAEHLRFRQRIVKRAWRCQSTQTHAHES